MNTIDFYSGIGAGLVVFFLICAIVITARYFSRPRWPEFSDSGSTDVMEMCEIAKRYGLLTEVVGSFIWEIRRGRSTREDEWDI